MSLICFSSCQRPIGYEDNSSGKKKFKSGDYIGSLKDFRKAFDLSLEAYNKALNKTKDISSDPAVNENAEFCAEILLNISDAFKVLNDYDNAILYCGHATELSGPFKNARAHFKLAMLHKEDNIKKNRNFDDIEIPGIGKFNGSKMIIMQEFNSATIINPSYAEAYYEKGIFQVLIGEKTAACSSFKKAADLGYKKAKDQIKINCQ